MTARPARDAEPLAFISVSSTCQDDCVFCGLKKYGIRYRLSLEEVGAQLEQLHEDASRVVFTGGEPLIHPDILRIVDTAKRIGYTEIVAFTSASPVRTKELAARLADAGLNGAMVSLHGCTPETHDRAVRRRGSFAQTVRGLGLLAKAGVHVVVNTPITSINVKQIAAMYDFLAELGEEVHRWQLSDVFPTAAVMDEPAVMPDYTDVRTALAETLALARRGPLRCVTQEFPLCIVYPYLGSTRAVTDQRAQLISRRDLAGDYRRYRPCTSPYKTKLPACEGCGMLDDCTGVPLPYLLSHRDLSIFRPLVGPMPRLSAMR